MLYKVEHHQILALSCRGRLWWIYRVQFKNNPILILLSHWNLNYPIVVKARKVGMFFPLPKEKRMLLADRPKYHRNRIGSHFLE